MNDWKRFENQLIRNAVERDKQSAMSAWYKNYEPISSTEFWTRELLKRHPYELIYWVSDVMRTDRETIRGFDTMACFRPMAARVVLREWASIRRKAQLDWKLDEICQEYMSEMLYDLSLHTKLSRDHGYISHWFPYLLIIPNPSLCPSTFEPTVVFKHARAYHSIDPIKYPDYAHQETNPFPEDYNLPFL